LKKILLLFTILISVQASYAQKLKITGTSTYLTYNNAQSGESSKEFTKDKSIDIKFDRFYVKIRIFINDNVSVIYEEESNEWEQLNVILYDFDKDGVDEYIVSLWDGGIENNCTVYKTTLDSDNSEDYKIIGKFIGQAEINFIDNKVIFPIGTQNIFLEYEYKSGKFKQNQ
jgi:hypothetical protein